MCVFLLKVHNKTFACTKTELDHIPIQYWKYTKKKNFQNVFATTYAYKLTFMPMTDSL